MYTHTHFTWCGGSAIVGGDSSHTAKLRTNFTFAFDWRRIKSCSAIVAIKQFNSVNSELLAHTENKTTTPKKNKKKHGK